jgi:hypothetical protein
MTLTPWTANSPPRVTVAYARSFSDPEWSTSFICSYYTRYYMNLETLLWKRSERSYATTVPHQLLFNLEVPEKSYKVIWKFNERLGKWAIDFEEI